MPPETQPPLALRPRDAAKVLGVSTRTLWSWTHSGIIPCCRIGTGKRRVVLYDLHALREWLRAQAEAAKGGGR